MWSTRFRKVLLKSRLFFDVKFKKVPLTKGDDLIGWIF